MFNLLWNCVCYFCIEIKTTNWHSTETFLVWNLEQNVNLEIKVFERSMFQYPSYKLLEKG